MKKFLPDTLIINYDPDSKLERGCADAILHQVNQFTSLLFAVDRCDLDCNCETPNIRSVLMAQQPSWLTIIGSAT